jgi:hypothetical protein
MTSFGFLEVLPDQPVLSPARASEALVKTTTTLTHPPYLPGRNTGHQSIILYVPRHHGSGGNQGAAPYGMATDNRAVRAQGRALAYARTRVNAMHRKVRPRRAHIREYARRTTENIVFQLYAFVDGYVVLDSNTVTDPDVVRYVDILSQRTVTPDNGSLLNVTKMPNFRSRADGYSIVDIRTFMNEEVRHNSFSKHSRGTTRPGYVRTVSISLPGNYSLMEVIMAQRLSSFML